MSYPKPTPAELAELRRRAEAARFETVKGPDNATEMMNRRHAEVILGLIDAYERARTSVRTNAADVFQVKCLRTVKSEPGDPTLNLCALGLGGETGEVIEPVKKHLFHGKPLDPEHVMLELGDVLWYAAVMAHALGYELSQVMECNVDKLEARQFEKTGQRLLP